MSFLPSHYSGCDCSDEGHAYGDAGCSYEYGALSTTSGVSQNGWPANKNPALIGVKTFTLNLRNGTKKVQLAEKAAPPLLEMAEWWDRNIEPVTQIGGYNWREIRGYEGTGKLSNHASGSGLDLNWDKHPLGASNTVTPSQAAAINAKAASLGLIWGAGWRRPDPMHFELAKSKAAAVASAAAGTAVAQARSPLLWMAILGIGSYYGYKYAERHGYIARVRARLRLPNPAESLCAWCGKSLGQADTKRTSHGICAPCKEKVLADIPKKKKNRRRSR